MMGKELLEQVVRIADGKKARDIVAMEVENQTSFTDYIVLMTGTSSTHIKALSDEIEFKLKQQGVQPHHIEGVTSNWILLDYTTVVVNIFTADAREMYALERLWGDSENVDVAQFLKKEEEK